MTPTTACAQLDNPVLREKNEGARRELEQIIDHINSDQLLVSDFSEQALQNAEKLIQTFLNFIAENKDEIEALSFLSTILPAPRANL